MHCHWCYWTISRSDQCSTNAVTEVKVCLTHLWEGRKKGISVFNDVLNTFCMRLYGVWHMVKNYSDSERGNPLPPHGLFFPISSWVLLYASSHRQDSTDHGLYYTSHWRKEGNVLFNDALNTFYLRLYGVRHMVKDHSDSEKGNPLPPHRLLFPINSKGSFICTIPQTG